MTTRLICACAATILALQTLACGSTSVTQMTGPDPTRCQASLAAVPTLPAAGGRVDVGVVTQRECAWSAASNASWVQLSPTSGQGEASLTLSTTANPQGTARTGNITLNGSQYAVTQAPSPCTFSATPSQLNVPSAGGAVNVHVATLAGCAWTARSTSDWLSVTPASTTGSGDVTITATANATSGGRTGTVTVAGTTIQLTQAAPVTSNPTPGPGPTPPGTNPSPDPGPAPFCSYELDPTSRSFKSKGGDATVKVKTSALCPWTATSNVSWVQITSGSVGLGSDEVKYDVDRNRGPARTGTVTIAGQIHLITQDAGD